MEFYVIALIEKDACWISSCNKDFVNELQGW